MANFYSLPPEVFQLIIEFAHDMNASDLGVYPTRYCFFKGKHNYTQLAMVSRLFYPACIERSTSWLQIDLNSGKQIKALAIQLSKLGRSLKVKRLTVSCKIDRRITPFTMKDFTELVKLLPNIQHLSYNAIQQRSFIFNANGPFFPNLLSFSLDSGYTALTSIDVFNTLARIITKAPKLDSINLLDCSGDGFLKDVNPRNQYQQFVGNGFSSEFLSQLRSLKISGTAVEPLILPGPGLQPLFSANSFIGLTQLIIHREELQGQPIFLNLLKAAAPTLIELECYTPPWTVLSQVLPLATRLRILTLNSLLNPATRRTGPMRPSSSPHLASLLEHENFPSDFLQLIPVSVESLNANVTLAMLQDLVDNPRPALRLKELKVYKSQQILSSITLLPFTIESLYLHGGSVYNAYVSQWLEAGLGEGNLVKGSLQKLGGVEGDFTRFGIPGRYL